VLLAGYLDVIGVATNYGYKKVIDVRELAAIYPEAVPCDTVEHTLGIEA